MKRVLLIPGLLLVALSVICYFASAGPLRDSKNRPIVMCNIDDIRTLDVGEMSWQTDIRTAMALWEGLAQYDPNTLKPIPGAAESWDLSPDQKTYTFHLRKNGRWSNGDPVTAQDFIFAWRRVFIPSTGANYLTFLYLIDGGEEYGQAIADNKPADFSKVGVSAPDPYTLVVRLKYPRGYFLDLCAFPTFFPLNEKSMRPFLVDPADPMKGYDNKWTRSPYLVTNGAFRLADWKFKQYLLLEPNENYWDRANVQCDRLVIKSVSDPQSAFLAYESGTVDVITSFQGTSFGEDLLGQMDKGRKDIHYMPVFGTYYYIYNCTRKPLDDWRVRKALSLAVDRRVIADDVVRMRERPIGLLVPPHAIPGYVSPKTPNADISEAKRLLAEAGFPDGRGMRSLEILYNSDVPVHGQVSLAIGQMWEKNLGIHVTFRGLERGSFGAERQIEHNFDIGRAGWYGDYNDPTTWLNLARTGDQNNDGLFSNAEYDALLDKAAAEPDAARRLSILGDAEGIIMGKEFPFLPLFQYSDGSLYDDTKIGGIPMNVRLLMMLKWIHRK